MLKPWHERHPSRILPQRCDPLTSTGTSLLAFEHVMCEISNASKARSQKVI